MFLGLFGFIPTDQSSFLGLYKLIFIWDGLLQSDFRRNSRSFSFALPIISSPVSLRMPFHFHPFGQVFMSRHRYVQQTLVVDYNRPALGGNCQLLDRLRVFVMYLPNEVIYLFLLILFWPAFRIFSDSYWFLSRLLLFNLRPCALVTRFTDIDSIPISIMLLSTSIASKTLVDFKRPIRVNLVSAILFWWVLFFP